MHIYLLFTLIIISMMIIYTVTNKKILYWITTMCMCLFIGLRYKVGTDYDTYNSIFKNAKYKSFENYDGDLGFLILSKAISVFTENARVHFLLVSSLIVVIMMIFIYKNSSLKYMSVFLYITMCGYLSSFNIMRQWIAISICVYSIKYIQKNNKLKYYICVGIAAMFHITAIIFIPIKLLMDLEWNRKTYLIIGGIGILVCLNLNFFIMMAGKATRFSNYINGYYTNVGANVMFLLVFGSMMAFCYLNRGLLENGMNNIFLKISFINIIFLLFGTQGLIFNRLAGYFNIGFIICIPEILNTMNKKEKRVWTSFIIFCSLMYMTRYLYTNGNLIPYRII